MSHRILDPTDSSRCKIENIWSLEVFFKKICKIGLRKYIVPKVLYQYLELFLLESL